MFCPKCGTENPDDAKFCTNCGAKLGVTSAPSKTSKSKVKSKAKSKEESKDETSIDLEPNIAGLLCYVAGWISGIVFLVLEKKSTFVKFHAWQSIMTFGILTVVQIAVAGVFSAMAVATFSPGLLVFAGFLNTLIWLLMVALWITLMVKAGTGKMWKLPWVGDWAEKQASKAP